MTITVAVPSKGRLKEQVLQFLKSRGYPVAPQHGKKLSSHVEGKEHIHVAFMHARDIAYMLHEGLIDIGITGLDLLFETRVEVESTLRLGIGKVKMCLLVPEASLWSHPLHLENKTIATPFPAIAKDYFNRLNIVANIRPISGASEGMVHLGVADAIIDIVETGGACRDNGLKIICYDIFDSECVLAVKRQSCPQIYDFLRALQ